MAIVFFQNPAYPYRGRFYIAPMMGAGYVHEQDFDGTLEAMRPDAPKKVKPSDLPVGGTYEGTPESG